MNRNFYLGIGTRIFLFATFSSLSGYFLASKGQLAAVLALLVAALIVALNLVYFINLTNKRIKFFFDAVKNDDSNLAFPTGSRNRSLRELYRSMTRVNEHIQQLKIENRQQEQYFSILIEHLATGIIIFNSKGFIIHSNTAARKLISAETLTHLKQIERIDRKLFNAVTEIRPSRNRLVSVHSEKGDLQLSLRATHFRKGEELFTILSLNDIKNELDEKELDSWIKLIRVLMHEIMNSITPITSLSESLTGILRRNDNPVGPDEIDEKSISTMLQGLGVIKEQGRGLMSFVESYRKLTKIPEPEKKSFKIADLIARMKILFKSLGNCTHIELTVALNDPAREVFADENLISQVLINLLKNAIEANYENPFAKIAIKAGQTADNHTEICVVDNGPGIAPENLDKIFVPFYTTRQDGSGIGLSISKQIMRVHGGNLRVRSVPDVETAFCITF